MALQPFVLAQVRDEWLALKNEKLAPELKKFNFEMQRVRPLLLELHGIVPQWWYGRLVSQDVFRTVLEKSSMSMDIDLGPGLGLDYEQVKVKCIQLQEDLKDQVNVFLVYKSFAYCTITLTLATKKP